MKKMMKNEKGFTLIELIIVIAILAIIAAIAIPNILGAVDNSRKSTDVANAKIILNAAAQVNAKNEDLVPISITNLSTGTVVADSYHEALAKELNNAIPVPKFKGTGVGSGTTEFSLAVDPTTGIMSVSTVGGTVVQVAPVPNSAYDQN